LGHGRPAASVGPPYPSATRRHRHTATPTPPRRTPCQEGTGFFAAPAAPLLIEPGLLTHLTRLTCLRIRGDVCLPNDPAALPSAGGSLRVLELARDFEDENRADPPASLEALIPHIATGLEALDINDSCLTASDATRLAAALPRGMARLHIVPRWGLDIQGAWAALPVTSLTLPRLPADLLPLLAGASRLERLSLRSVPGDAIAALVAVLRALPRLRVLELGERWSQLFTGDGGAPVAPEAVDAFVEAVAGLPSLRELRVSGCPLGGHATTALVEAAPRLSALRLAHCGLSDSEAAELAARLRAAAGCNALSLDVCRGPV
jgi:hypothetical protein